MTVFRAFLFLICSTVAPFLQRSVYNPMLVYMDFFYKAYRKWCRRITEANVKLETWTLVCRRCLYLVTSVYAVHYNISKQNGLHIAKKMNIP